MALSGSQVILYAADAGDYQYALAAAALAGIPVTNAQGNFYDVWNEVASGNFLVIAVGLNANTALYLNTCGWPNPAGSAGGSTPFAYATEPQAALPGSNYFENAAGTSGQNTMKLAAMLAYYATHDGYPPNFGTTLPTRASASSTCPSSSNRNQSCPC